LWPFSSQSSLLLRKLYLKINHSFKKAEHNKILIQREVQYAKLSCTKQKKGNE